MRNLRFLFPALLLLAACNDGLIGEQIATPSSNANVYIHFENQMDGSPLVLSNVQYKNGLGTSFNVNTLKYYISNIALSKSDTVAAVLFDNYELIDQENEASKLVTLSAVPNDTYNTLRFAIGVDKERNHSGSQTGDLDPVNGMFWTWKTGYIFLKHEGMYTDSTGASKMLSFHYASDAAYTEVVLPITAMVVKGVERHIYVTFDLNKVYKANPKIDFHQDNFRHSERGDEAWVSTMRRNLPGGFSITAIE